MAWKAAPPTPPDEINDFIKQFRKKARFLVDESLGVEVANVLRNLGWNAKFVGEVGLTRRDDIDVLAYSWSEDSILLTHDTDFLDDRRFPEHRNPGVVILPGGSGDEEALIRAVAGLLSIVAPFRKGFRGTKVQVSNDGVWTFIKRNKNTGAIERTRIRISKNGTVEIWEG